MNRIATGQVYSSALLGVLTAQGRQAEAGRQVASGYKAVDLKGYASEGAALTAAQSVKARTDTLLANNKVLADRLAAQDDALTGVEQAAGGARKAVADAFASGDGAQLVQKLNAWLGQTTQSLNARFGEDSLFAGGTTDREPVDVTQIADLTAPGAAAKRFHDGAFHRTDRLDEEQTAQTGFTATEVGAEFVGILADIAAYNEPPTGPFGTKLTTAQTDFLQSKLAPLDTATANVRALVAKNGALQARLDTVAARQSARSDAAGALIDSKASVDPAEAASRLQLAGVALQASAQVFAPFPARRCWTCYGAETLARLRGAGAALRRAAQPTAARPPRMRRPTTSALLLAAVLAAAPAAISAQERPARPQTQAVTPPRPPATSPASATVPPPSPAARPARRPRRSARWATGTWPPPPSARSRAPAVTR